MTTQRILIAGCGYVGEAAADVFHAKGWEVGGWTASSESAARFSSKPYRVQAVDIADETAVAGSAGTQDVVIQCVSSRGGDAETYRALYFKGARNLQAAFPNAHLIFTGSTSVYAQNDGSIVDERSPAEPTHERGKILRATENFVLENGGVVARLAGIYGPGRSHLLQKFLDGKAVIDPEDDRFINQAHRDDIVSALVLLAESVTNIRGEIFNIADGEPAKANEIYTWLAARLQRPIPVLGKTAASSKRGKSNKRVSNQKLRSMAWQPCYASFREAMNESILPSFGL